MLGSGARLPALTSAPALTFCKMEIIITAMCPADDLEMLGITVAIVLY